MSFPLSFIVGSVINTIAAGLKMVIFQLLLS